MLHGVVIDFVCASECKWRSAIKWHGSKIPQTWPGLFGDQMTWQQGPSDVAVFFFIIFRRSALRDSLMWHCASQSLETTDCFDSAASSGCASVMEGRTRRGSRSHYPYMHRSVLWRHTQSIAWHVSCRSPGPNARSKSNSQVVIRGIWHSYSRESKYPASNMDGNTQTCIWFENLRDYFEM